MIFYWGIDKEFPEWTLWDYETILNNRAIDSIKKWSININNQDTNSIISSIQESLIQQAKDIKTDLPNNCQ